jgi:hypothetical protein
MSRDGQDTASAPRTKGWKIGLNNDWSADGPGNHSTIHILAKGRKAPIAIVCQPMRGYRDGDAELDAHARLISAAPDMLEALKYLMSAHGEQLHDAFDEAHKAIAKAEGNE